MPDNVNITVNETIENVVINPSISTDVIDVNITSTTENVNIAVTPELTTININSVTSVSPVTSVNGQIGDVVIPTSDNNFTTTLKNKLDGIQTGAEVNVNADWNATSGDAQILNKPSIPSIAGLATTTYVDTQDALKVDKNTAITGATKTKITYDSKGLVTSGADATTADIADSLNKRYQTDNQQSFNDATSSIQTQLNAKQSQLDGTGFVKASGTTISYDNNKYNPIIISNYAAVQHTGTTVITILKSFLIPANTFKQYDCFNFNVGLNSNYTKSGTATLRIYSNITNSLTGASILATYTYATTNRYALMKRTGVLYSPNSGIAIADPLFSLVTDEIANTSGFNSNDFFFQQDTYFIVTCQLSNISDTVFLNTIRLTK